MCGASDLGDGSQMTDGEGRKTDGSSRLMSGEWLVAKRLSDVAMCGVIDLGRW